MKINPSDKPQKINGKDSYYYESNEGIDVCMWKKGMFYEVRIPWNKLLKSAKRCGKI